MTHNLVVCKAATQDGPSDFFLVHNCVKLQHTDVSILNVKADVPIPTSLMQKGADIPSD